MFTDQTLTNLRPPPIIGPGLIGTSALATHGTWTRGAATGIVYSYQREICTSPAGQGCTPITGATPQLSPRLRSTESGSYLAIALTAASSNGLTGHALASSLVTRATDRPRNRSAIHSSTWLPSGAKRPPLTPRTSSQCRCCGQDRRWPL